MNLRFSALMAITCGVVLHLYTALFLSDDGIDGFVFGLLLAWWLPYAICAALLVGRRTPHMALGGAATTLAADLWTFAAVFIAPQGSTAPLMLLFSPLWNLLLITPAGLFAGWLVARKRAAR